MGVKDPGSARLIATLGATGLLSGLILVSVFIVTEPRIQRNRAEALRRAIYNVLPGTSQIATFVVRDGRLAPYDGPQDSIPTEPAVYSGKLESGELVGYAIAADGPGYMDTIKLLYGFDPRRRVVVGMEVLESRETPGLGDKIITDEEFLENFDELAVEPTIVPVKKGQKAQQNEVDCITGATISSESVVSILNLSTQQWLPLLEAASQESEVARHGDTARR